MAYGFDLSGVTLTRFRGVIETGYLIPSMLLLRDDIDRRFEAVSSQGFASVADLGREIANQKKADAFAARTGIDGVYVTALRRLIASYKPKPRKLDEFPDISPETLMALEQQGIRTSKTLFDYLEAEDPSSVRAQLHLSEQDEQLIRSLIEVTQLRYVSPLFATAMVKSGHDSIPAVARSERGAFVKALVAVNEEHDIYKGNIGDTDVQFLIDDAKFFLEIQGS